MRGPVTLAAVAMALAAVIPAGAIATADQAASTATSSPSASNPGAPPAQAQTRLEELATRYYMVIPDSSRPAS